MRCRARTYYTEGQKSQMWGRWQPGESLHQIARLFDRHYSSVRRILAESGGIRPPQRRCSPRTLPKPDNALIAIRARAIGEWHPNGRSVIWLDPYQAQVVQVHDATAQDVGARVSETMYPLHGGFVGGRFWQWGVALTGLVPAFLLVTCKKPSACAPSPNKLEI